MWLCFASESLRSWYGTYWREMFCYKANHWRGSIKDPNSPGRYQNCIFAPEPRFRSVLWNSGIFAQRYEREQTGAVRRRRLSEGLGQVILVCSWKNWLWTSSFIIYQWPFFPNNYSHFRLLLQRSDSCGYTFIFFFFDIFVQRRSNIWILRRALWTILSEIRESDVTGSFFISHRV